MRIVKTYKKKQRGGATETIVRSDRINGFRVGIGEHDGYMSPSEDRHTVLPVGDMSLLVCVFDGHSGSKVVEYLNKNLPIRIKRRIEEGAHYRDVDAIKKIMEEEFLRVDDELKVGRAGSTGSVAFINPTTIVVANVGDSPVLYFTKEGNLLFHSDDHDCSNESEVKRIEEVGGKCLEREDGAIGLFGALMVTRAFGDYRYKPSVIAKPQTYSVERKPGTYLVVCSDSFTERYVPSKNQIMNIASHQNVVKTILPTLTIENGEEGIHTTIEAQVKQDFFFHADNPVGNQYAGDNTTLVVVTFEPESKSGGRRHRKVRKGKTRKNK